MSVCPTYRNLSKCFYVNLNLRNFTAIRRSGVKHAALQNCTRRQKATTSGVTVWLLNKRRRACLGIECEIGGDAVAYEPASKLEYKISS